MNNHYKNPKLFFKRFILSLLPVFVCFTYSFSQTALPPFLCSGTNPLSCASPVATLCENINTFNGDNLLSEALVWEYSPDGLNWSAAATANVTSIPGYYRANWTLNYQHITYYSCGFFETDQCESFTYYTSNVISDSYYLAPATPIVETIIAPADVNVNNDPGLCTASNVNLGNPVTTISCGVASITNDAPSVFPVGQTTVTWKNAGADGTSATATQLVTVTDVEKPTIIGTTSVCIGKNTSLSGVAAGGSWSSDNSSVATIDANGLVTGVSQGIAIITYTVAKASGCPSSATVAINVLALPSVQPISGNTNVCVGSVVSLTDATAGGTWKSANPSIASVTKAGVVTILKTGTATINYTLTNGNGCAGTASIVFTVTPVAAITGNKIICAGTNTQLADATSGGMWTSSDPTIASISLTGLVAGLTPGTTTITYSGIPGNCVLSATAIVTVKEAAVVGPISGPSVVAPGTSITLTDPTVGGVWSNTNTAIANITQAGVLNGIAPGKTNVTYQVSNTYGCSASATASVTVTKPLVISVKAAAITCNDASTTLQATVTGGSGSFLYSLNGGATQSSNSFSVTGGSYTVQVTDNASSQTASASIVISQPLPLTLSLESETNSSNGLANGSFTVDGSGGVAPYKYSMNGKAYQASNAFTTLKAGTYFVSVKDANNCSVSAALTVVLSDGITKNVTQTTAVASIITLDVSSTNMQWLPVYKQPAMNINLRGAVLGYTYLLNKYWGVTANLEISAGYNQPVRFNQYNALAGMSYYPEGLSPDHKLNLSIRGLTGYSATGITTVVNDLKLNSRAGGLAFDLGGTLDLNLSRKIDLRLLNIDYLHTGNNFGGQTGFRFSTGIGIKLK